MNTIFIVDWFGEKEPQFIVVNKDYSHLEGVVVNAGSDYGKEEELSNLLDTYAEEDENGFSEQLHSNVEYLDEWPYEVAASGDYKVVRVGLMP